jgi:hypothetical protein
VLCGLLFRPPSQFPRWAGDGFFATFLRGPAASISSKQQDYYIYADKVITVNIGALHLRCFEWFTKIHNNSNNNDSTNNNKPVVKIPQKSEYRNHCMN